MTTTTPTTTTHPVMTTLNIQPVKTVMAGQQKKVADKGKAKSTDKRKKNPPKTNTTTSGPSSNLCSQLRDKAKHTAALIQEITEELQAIEEEATQEDQNLDVTQLSNLEQEDSDIPLTEDEQ